MLLIGSRTEIVRGHVAELRNPEPNVPPALLTIRGGWRMSEAEEEHDLPHFVVPIPDVVFLLAQSGLFNGLGPFATTNFMFCFPALFRFP
jgi:hypothetical protein